MAFKKKERVIEAHVSPARLAIGDNYPVGIKNPVGKSKDVSIGGNAVSKSKLKNPPKSLA